MREWQLRSGDPLCLTLATDVRLEKSDYVDDQIWELSLSGGEPVALSLQTTFGLRARSMRLFPQFTIGDQTLIEPATFSQPPTVAKILPNFILLSFSPVANIDVEAEIWVPQPHVIAGRYKITNNSKTNRPLRLDLIAQLAPAEGHRMAPLELQAATVLSGLTGGLAPIFFMTGGAKAGAGSYPSLALKMDLAPNEQRQTTWALAATMDRETSFELARRIAGQKWDAELTRIELLNSGQVEIYTGDPDWDAALMLAQKQAIQLMMSDTEHLPHPSFVISRQPDQGYSRRGDGGDYNHLWNGQSPLDAYYLADILLPIAPDLAEGLARNFLAVQAEDGFIDWKPGLVGQRSKLIATPLLVSLVWRIYEFNENIAFLEESFDPLRKFVQLWFTPDHDRDGDGFPEWDHPMQAGIEDHPLYSPWRSWSLGVDISMAECPALAAMLYRECITLARMARILERNEALPELEALADRLKALVETTWDEASAIYMDRDRDTHFCTHGELLVEGKGSRAYRIEKDFQEPVRLLINIFTDETVRRRPTVFIHGVSASGRPRVVRIPDEHFQWTPGWGRLTGQQVFSALKRIEVHGLEPEDRIHVSSVGYDQQDCSQLLPLWAGIPDQERARRLMDETILNPQRFWRTYGLPTVWRSPETPEAAILNCVNLPWNVLILEGLLQYGFRAQAAELMSRWMKAIIQNLKREGAFHRYYQADTGEGCGERNALNGLTPVGQFLNVLGVRLISPRRVALAGFNPFPSPITVKYRGLSVLRQTDKTIVVFPDGQTVTVDDPAPRMISLE